MNSVLLLDIEGTTTPISFVYEVLFPYARQAFASFLSEHWSDAEVSNQVRQLGANLHDPAAATRAVLELMDQDRKLGPLKALQGLIWEHGYRSGALKSQLFADVAPVLRWRKARGLRTFIYSSGSVLAQKLLFEHTSEGDLRGLLDGYFDTAVGSKGEAASYRVIANEIGASGVFATDVVAEALAAREAGWGAVILNRPGNHPQPDHAFPVWDSLEASQDSTV